MQEHEVRLRPFEKPEHAWVLTIQYLCGLDEDFSAWGFRAACNWLPVPPFEPVFGTQQARDLHTYAEPLPACPECALYVDLAMAVGGFPFDDRRSKTRRR